MIGGIFLGILACIIIYLVDRDNLFGKKRAEEERKKREEQERKRIQEKEQIEKQNKEHERFLKQLEHDFGHKN